MHITANMESYQPRIQSMEDVSRSLYDLLLIVISIYCEARVQRVVRILCIVVIDVQVHKMKYNAQTNKSCTPSAQVTYASLGSKEWEHHQTRRWPARPLIMHSKPCMQEDCQVLIHFKSCLNCNPTTICMMPLP